MVKLIGSVTTDQGLRVKAALGTKAYAPGIKVSDADLAGIKLKRDEFHGEWNYRVTPRATGQRGKVFKLFLPTSLAGSAVEFAEASHRWREVRARPVATSVPVEYPF